MTHLASEYRNPESHTSIIQKFFKPSISHNPLNDLEILGYS